MANTIGVTGASGRLGGRVARLLAEAGIEQTLLLRSPEKAPQLAEAEVARMAYTLSDETIESLSGIETLLLVSAGESADRLAQHQAVIDAAARAGVQHVVYTSFIGAAPDSTFALARDHGSTEAMLRESGMAWTFLRDNFYQEAFLDFAVDGVIAGPAGQGRVAAVAIDDVARVAAAVLQDPTSHRDATYDLTGPQALTIAEIAEQMTRVAGRPTRYQEESVEEAYASRASYQAPAWQLDAWVSTYTAIAEGDLELVSGAVEQVTGQPAQSFEETLAALGH